MIRENNIFIVGIKGVAMANLAVILKKMGKNVIGSDVSEEFITDDLLKKNNLHFSVGFKAVDLPKKTELIVYSAAHGGINNPQVVEAKRRNILALSQTELLGQIMSQFKNKIAVCGCHGKTTTTSLLAYSLIKLKVKPSYLVGSPNFDGYDGADYNTTLGAGYFVIEADEYGVDPPRDKTPKFLFLKPNYILCPNIDFDHPDVFKNLKDTVKAFMKFFNVSINQLIDTKLFLCADDQNLIAISRGINHFRCSTYGYSNSADLKIIHPNITEVNSSFDLIFKKKFLGQFTIPLFGKKNISNAAGVVLILLSLGFSAKKIKEAIEGFSGAKRRFEKIDFINDIYLFDDYGHHPAEIKATIQATQLRFSQRRLVVIFQPHTFSRTWALKRDFALSLSLADLSIVCDIFPSARERKEDFKISSLDIEKEARNKNKNNVIYVPKKKLLNFLKKNLKKGDAIFTMGAGDVYKLKDDIIEIIKKIV
jgi:UDP-N-acetylmuramate--alanine ligase